MKNKKLLVLLTIITTILIAFASVSFAASAYGSPAEIIAGLTNKSVDEVYDSRSAGETFGEQAIANGVLSQFQDERINLMEDRFAQLVEDGRISQEDADARLKLMEDAIADCDGTGDGAYGGGFGGMMGGRGSYAGQGICGGVPAQDGTGSQYGGRGGRGGMGGWAQGTTTQAAVNRA